jgi:hypothetical protein
MEANYARVLELQRKSGLIVYWKHECRTFWFEGIKRGCVSYLPDFEVVTKDGELRYDEVKGFMCPKSKTKLKRMEKYFPKVKVVLIQKKEMDGFERTCSKLCKDWE